MKKFIITSDVFAGEVHVVYDADNKFGAVDFLSAEISGEQIEWVYSRIPIVYTPESFAARFNATNITITEQGFEVTFDMFWEKYGLKLNRKRCMGLWEKLSAGKKLKAYYGITAYNNHLAHFAWQSKANPDRYLRDEYWENEWKTAR